MIFTREEKSKLAKEKKEEKARIAKEKKEEKARIVKEKKEEKARIAKEKKEEKARIAEEKKEEKARIAKEKKEGKAKIAKDKTNEWKIKKEINKEKRERGETVEYEVTKYQVVKTYLKTIVKDDEAKILSKNDIIKKINDAVIICNKITMHALQLIKAYFLYLNRNSQPHPKITRIFIFEALKIFKTDKLDISDTLSLNYFYTKLYKPNMIDENLKMGNIDQILYYASVSLFTVFNNNIKQRFKNYINKFVDVSLHKDQIISEINKNKINAKDKIKEFKRELGRVKSAIYEIDDVKRRNIINEIPQYYVWIHSIRSLIIPYKKAYKENNIIYDVKASEDVFDYFQCMFYMMQDCERLGCKKLNNLFPLRSDIAPKYFKFDTSAILKLLFPSSNKGTKYEGKQYYSSNIIKCQEIIWDRFFKTTKKIFDKANGFSFHFMIETDGVGCSIILSRKEKIQNFNDESEKYVDDENLIHTNYLNKNIVGIDPNKSDLIFCMDSYQNKFRYTQCQRNKEIGFKKNKIIRNRAKMKTKILFEGKNHNINEIESKLSLYNKKTTDYDKFIEYIKIKNQINSFLEPFYYKRKWRVMKFETISRSKKSEDQMLNAFSEVFGGPDEVVIAFGNYGGAHMKGIDPVKGKGFRKTFRRAGFEVLLVDEFRTSKLCSHCRKQIRFVKNFPKK